VVDSAGRAEIDDDVLGTGEVHEDSVVVQVEVPELDVEEELRDRDRAARLEGELEAVGSTVQAPPELGGDVEVDLEPHEANASLDSRPGVLEPVRAEHEVTAVAEPLMKRWGDGDSQHSDQLRQWQPLSCAFSADQVHEVADLGAEVRTGDSDGSAEHRGGECGR